MANSSSGENNKRSTPSTRRPAKKTTSKAAAKTPKKTAQKAVKKTPAKPAAKAVATKKKTVAKKAPTTARKTKKATASKPAAAASKPTAAKPAAEKPAARPEHKADATRSNPFLDAAMETPAYTDMARFAEYMADINIRTQDILKEATERRADKGRRAAEQPADPLNVAEAGSEVATALSQQPIKLMQMQLGLWDGYTKLFTNTMEKMAGKPVDPIAAPKPGDRRFRHAAWEENPMLDFVKQSYLLLSEWVDNAIQEADGVDPTTKRRAHFHADQILSAMSPTNVPALNPEVIDETLSTQGSNWLAGLRNFLDDLERGHGELAIKQADLDFFNVGENIATTPGKVVYQNDMLQLIQYAPKTQTVAERPMVIFPPWINKFYILDLQPENSFISWLVEQGRTVFVVSWVNPGPELKEKSFPDYMREGVFEVLAAVEKATGVRSMDTIGYCIGGTLLSVTLGYMAQIGDDRINSATFFTAQTDFKEAGDLLLFVDEKQLSNIEKQIDAAGGVLEGSAMARTFNMLRPDDLIWASFVDNYYKGKDAKKFDLLYWNADTTRMTKACHLYYLRNFYHENLLSRGMLDVEGVPIDLAKIDIPIFMQAGERDHIAPARSVYRSAVRFGSDDVQYMLAGSGHIAGVINHPSKEKYHYSTNTNLPDTVEEWQEGAERHEYSWWPYWLKWLNARSGGSVPARIPGDGELTPIEDAPGTYVKVRCG